MTQILEFMGGNGVLKVRARIRKPRSRSRSPRIVPRTLPGAPPPTFLGPIIGQMLPMTPPELLAPAPRTPESQ